MNRNEDKKGNDTSTATDASPHGSERDADAQRPGGGPRYHGAGWERAAEEEEHGGEPVSGPRADDPVRVEPGQVPGTKAKPGTKAATGKEPGGSDAA